MNPHAFTTRRLLRPLQWSCALSLRLCRPVVWSRASRGARPFEADYRDRTFSPSCGLTRRGRSVFVHGGILHSERSHRDRANARSASQKSETSQLRSVHPDFSVYIRHLFTRKVGACCKAHKTRCVRSAFGERLISTLHAVFPLRKFYTERMFVLVRMQLRNHVDARAEKAFKALKWELYTILNLQCCKCVKMRFLCANRLVVLRICLPERETLVAHVSNGAEKNRIGFNSPLLVPGL